MVIPHNLPTIDSRETRAVSRTIKSGWIGPGRTVRMFEEDFANLFQLSSDLAIAVSSGSAAIQLTLMGANLLKNKVIIPAYACVAIENAVRASGLEAVHLDSAKNSPLIPEHIDPLPDVGATIGISTFGNHYNFQPTSDFMKIADITHSLGKGTSFRKFSGDVAIASLGATKLITSGGQGGIILCKSSELAKQIRDIRDFDTKRDEKNRYNYQMTDIQASFGIIQLQKLSEFTERRYEIHEHYHSKLKELYSFQKDQIHYRALIRTSKPNELIDWLHINGISAIIPYEKYEMVDNLKSFKNARNFADQMVSIPIYPSLTTRQMRKIVNVIQKFESFQ